MFTYHSLIVLVRCCCNQNAHKILTSEEEPLNSENLEIFTHSQDRENISSNRTIDSLQRQEIAPIHINECEPTFNSNLKQQFNTFRTFNDTGSYHGNFSYEQNFVMKYNQIYFNIVRQLYEQSSAFTALQQQNNVNLHQESDIFEEGNANNLNEGEDATSKTQNHFGGSSVFNSNERSDCDERDKRILKSCRNTIKSKNKKLKTKHCDLKDLEAQNNLCISNITKSQEIKNFNSDEISDKESVEKKESHSFLSIEDFSRQLRVAMYGLNLLKAHEQKFLHSKIYKKEFYSSLFSDLQKLNEVADYTSKLCKKWFKNENFIIKDFMKNINIFELFLRAALDIRNTVGFFRDSIDQNILTGPVVIFDERSKKLKARIESNKKSIENLKQLGIDEMLGDKIPEDNLLNEAAFRDIKLKYQEDDNYSNIMDFKIPVKRTYFPSSIAVFEESIFLCIHSSKVYLKILKIDLKAKNHQEINKYVAVDKDSSIMRCSFGYGSKYSIIRSGSEGKLFLLKLIVKIPYVKNAGAKDSFEMLVVDKEFKKLASIQVDTIKSEHISVRPAIVDFVVHNDLVYALDIKNRCLLIFTELLVLLNRIPIPDSLDEKKIIHLAVSNKYILIASENNIYYIKNNDTAEFKTLDLDNFILNLAFYDDENIIVKFFDGCYSFKMEENSSDINYTHLPSLNQLKYLFLLNFTIKDNFIYSICKETHQIYKLKVILNTVN